MSARTEVASRVVKNMSRRQRPLAVGRWARRTAAYVVVGHDIRGCHKGRGYELALVFELVLEPLVLPLHALCTLHEKKAPAHAWPEAGWARWLLGAPRRSIHHSI